MKVVVTLVNAATGDPIGVTERSADSLPEAFTNGTELAIGDRRWGVVSAEPATRADCARLGTLRLTCARPCRIRSTQRGSGTGMVSICGDLPPLEPVVADGGHALVLHEDLWRDIELVGSRQQPAIDANLAAIERIERAASGAAGYQDIHVRTEPQAPLDGVEIGIDEVRAGLEWLPGGVVLSSAGGPARVVDGFAFALAEGPHLYGWAPEGRIRVLAVDAAVGTLPALVDELMRRHRLVLVDWRGRALVSPDRRRR